ncbi:MAG TPA: AMP-binding protein [Candidatus Sulfotelmatobacter sp.]|nr:AMP-binding protein [Candidatus Sulfotelmatobacter sp.]
MTTPDTSTLGSALERAAARWTDQEAFVCDGIRMAYRDLADAARRTAAALLARGVRKGDRVAVCMDNSAAWLTLFYANALIGAATVAVDPRLPPRALEQRLRQTGSALLVTVDRIGDAVDVIAALRTIEPALDVALPGRVLPQLRTVVVLGYAVPRGAVGYGAFQGQAGTGVTVDRAAVAHAAAAVAPDDAALVLDIDALSHATLLRDGAAAAKRIGIRPGDRYFSARPFHDLADVTPAILVAFSVGACLVTMPDFDAGEALRLMERERCTLVAGDDATARRMMEHPSCDIGRLSLRDGWSVHGS